MSRAYARAHGSACQDALHDPPEWGFEVRLLAGGGAITAFGELDLAVADRLEDLARALRPEPGDRIVADFSRVTFIDSSIVAFLLRVAARVDARDATLVVVARRDGEVRRTLRVCDAEGALGLPVTG
jgi:anti-anti-sigma factor